MSDEKYYGNANPDLLKKIPMNAKLVLEVGCGMGALGQAYKAENPSVCYIGIELFEQAAANARHFLDRVYCGNVETVSLTEVLNQGEQPDCLIYGDVLEHLQDPWLILRQHAEFLAENGTVIACIPNVQHWKTFIRLFLGEWSYSRQGLLDKTHVRFFDYNGVVDLFIQAGLTIEGIFARVFELPRQEEAVRLLTECGERIGIKDLKDFERKIAAMQYVVIARKKPND